MLHFSKRKYASFSFRHGLPRFQTRKNYLICNSGKVYEVHNKNSDHFHSSNPSSSNVDQSHSIRFLPLFSYEEQSNQQSRKIIKILTCRCANDNDGKMKYSGLCGILRSLKDYRTMRRKKNRRTISSLIAMAFLIIVKTTYIF